ncbi:MAG: sulfatase, partial [Kiritimatiellae bacterium]|nr:sulfatase [Kiritimatiellia bacterium]
MKPFPPRSSPMIPLIFAAGCVSCARSAEPARRPNILFMFSDDHAVQAISAYDTRLIETPNIDRIAREGVLFRGNYCANSICSPSRASVLTGVHSHINGVTMWQRFDGSQPTFPRLLQSAGYVTGVFGKWHLGSDPTGFDEWMIFPGQGEYYNPDYITPKGTVRIEGYSERISTDLVQKFIRDHKGDGKPFLAMLHFKAPHRNWMPGPDQLNLFRNHRFPEPPTLLDDYAGRAGPLARHRMGIGEHLRLVHDLKVPDRSGPVAGTARMTAAQRAAWDAAYREENEAFRANPPVGGDRVRWNYQRYIADYLRCIAGVDEQVGRMLKFLEDEGLADNTIVIYSSDQGFYLGEHGWYDKRWMFEESFRMPLMIRWPGRIGPGTEIRALTQNIDYAPTLLDAAGVPIPAHIQGRSLLPLIAQPSMPWRDALYY